MNTMYADRERIWKMLNEAHDAAAEYVIAVMTQFRDGAITWSEAREKVRDMVAD